MHKPNRLIRTAAMGLLAAGALSLSSCDEETLAAILGSLDSVDGYHSGYNVDNEDLTEIESDVNIAADYGDGENLPTSVDLTRYLPPIGDQGQYGTCVAWATAYNCRTFLNARTKGLNKSDLTNTSNQFSPKDIFLSIDSYDKGSDCGGTYFEAAFDKMISRGVATVANSPYTGLGSCSSSPSSSATSDAAKHKIKSYRKITVNEKTIKQYLAEGKLVVFGAYLGDEFMLADGNSIIYKQTTFQYTGQHAAHAMVISGYDDHKGSNGCFRVVNSWGTSWGDAGYIWVDYKFFCSGNFAYDCFVAYDINETLNSVEVSASNPDKVENTTSGIDLISTELNFYDPNRTNANGDKLWRCDYEVFNAGSQMVSASNDWTICLLYYNAYEGTNDCGILFVDYYSDDFGVAGDYSDDFSRTEGLSRTGIPAQAYCWNNLNIGAGMRVSAEVSEGAKGFSWDFQLPNTLNGQYYFALFADATDKIVESNEENNVIYFGAANNKPITFVDGEPTNLSKSPLSKDCRLVRQNDPSPNQDVRGPDNLNAYTFDEVQRMIMAQKKSGAISKMAQQWLDNNANQACCRRIIRK